MKRITLVLFLTVQLTGCLKTKADLRNEGSSNVEQKQIVAAQQAQAKPAKTATALKFDEYDDQMRAMNGRIDAVENVISQQNAAKKGEQDAVSKDRAAVDQRFVAYEEALKKLETEVQTLNDEVTKLKAPPAAAATPVSKKDSKTVFEEGQNQFKAKKWKDAILSYQKYRDANPKGKHYSEATYKMGVSFQELGLKDDAKPFLEEVVSKFPGSKDAKKAAFRLKNSK
jgi:TolA-binding protein